MIIFILHADQLTRFIILQGVGILHSVTKEASMQYSGTTLCHEHPQDWSALSPKIL